MKPHKTILLLLLITLAASDPLMAGPNPPMPKDEVLKLTGPLEGGKLSRDINNGVGIEDGKGSHSTRKLPILLAGGGKLGIKQGQHLVYEKDRTPLCNLHVTLMQSMGLERAHFVDGTGRLTGLG